MKILLLLLLPLQAFCQTALVDKDHYDRLVIVDELNINYSVIYGRIYKLNLKDSSYQLKLTQEYKRPDSLSPFYRQSLKKWDKISNAKPDRVVMEVERSKVDSLIALLNRPTGFEGLLSYYKIDSSWLSSNADRLFLKWLELTNKKDKVKIAFAQYVLNYFNHFSAIAYSHILQSNSSGYSNAVIAFENDSDTLVIQTAGQESFLLPWASGAAYKNYNYRVSVLASQLIPGDLQINKHTLHPSLEDFEKGILLQLSFKSNFIDKKKFKKFLKGSKAVAKSP